MEDKEDKLDNLCELDILYVYELDRLFDELSDKLLDQLQDELEDELLGRLSDDMSYESSEINLQIYNRNQD